MNRFIITLSSLALIFTSCELDINDNPNYPDSGTISADLVFPNAQLGLVATISDNMFNYAGFFAQYFNQLPESQQFDAISENRINVSDQVFDGAYRTLYSGVLADLEDVKKKTTSTADLLAVAVLRTMSFQLLVDNTDKTPYIESLGGNETPNPKYDDGDVVYKGVLAELDEALSAYKTNSEPMTVTDMMFGKNMTQWVGLANAVKLRMYMRMYEKDNSVKDKIVALVNDNDFFMGDAALDIFADVPGNRSPFYASYYELGQANHCASYPIIQYMLHTDDPRIEYCFNKATADGKYVGEIPGAKNVTKEWVGSENWKNKNVSNVNYKLHNGTGATRPGIIFTQANLQFLIAEVKLRFLNDEAGAKVAYEDAIKADFATRFSSYKKNENYNTCTCTCGCEDCICSQNSVVNVDVFLAGEHVNFDLAENKLELIYMQKWAAFCYTDHMEAWSEIRRTDVPKLSTKDGKSIFETPSIYTPGELIDPVRNSIVGGGLVKRLPYSYKSYTINQNAPEAVEINVPVWWDVK